MSRHSKEPDAYAQALSMKLAFIFNKQRPETTGVYFERACAALGVSYDHWALSDIGRTAASYGVYLQVDHGDDYTTPLPMSFRPAVFYAIDTHLAPSWRKIRRAAARYDRVYCAQAAAARQLRNGEWLPLACDPALHSGKEVARTVDVAFVGSDGGVPRKFYLQTLRERYPNHRIGSADHTQLGAIYGQVRIGFNYSIADDVNMRIFEVLASGACLLTNKLSHDDLEQLGFKDRHHLVYYRSPRELFTLIDYYLEHADEREHIARAGRRHVLEQHTYVHRMKALLNSMSRQLGVHLSSNMKESATCASL